MFPLDRYTVNRCGRTLWTHRSQRWPKEDEMGQVPVLGFDLLRRVPFWWSAPFCLLCVVHLQPADGPVQRPHPTPIRSGVLLDSVWTPFGGTRGKDWSNPQLVVSCCQRVLEQRIPDLCHPRRLGRAFRAAQFLPLAQRIGFFFRQSVKQYELLALSDKKPLLGHLSDQTTDHRSRASDHVRKISVRQFGHEENSALVSHPEL